MVIKRIRIDDFENIPHFESTFDSRLAVLPPGIEYTLLKAIGIILKSDLLAGDKIYASEKTLIQAEIAVDECNFIITATKQNDNDGFTIVVEDQFGNTCTDFYDVISQSTEEENLSYFALDRKNLFSERYKHYKDTEKYYSKGSFSKLTNGIGNTRLFRSCLSNHIKEYNESNKDNENNWQPVIKESGEVVLNSPSSCFDQNCLSESDAVLFEYMCYLDINRFWKEIEDIRDFNHTFWPLFINELCERTDEAITLTGYVNKALSLNRQVFVSDRVGR